MKAFVIYESLWGNTEAVARAIATGLGPGTKVGTTDEISAEEAAAADLVVAGAPVIAFSLGSDKVREGIARDEADAPRPPDLAHPSMRSWLDRLPHSTGRGAAFETRIWWSPRGATGDIERRLKGAGFGIAAPAHRFIVEGKYGPLRDGELERAEAWGRELASVAATA
jgi:hypothetical protein